MEREVLKKPRPSSPGRARAVTDACRFIETRRLLSFDERHARYVHVDSCCDLPMPKRDIEANRG
jgi:hypothetical protein